MAATPKDSDIESPTTTAMKEVWLLDSTGREWVSDPDIDGELTPDVEAEMRGYLKDLGKLDNFALTIGGLKYHFHPAHIVAWTIRPVAPNPHGEPRR